MIKNYKFEKSFRFSVPSLTKARPLLYNRLDCPAKEDVPLKKKTLLLLLICIALIALVGVLALVMGSPNRQAPENLEAAPGYVYISAGGQGKWFMLPEKETPLQLSRTGENGQEIRNVVVLFPQGAYMQSSTCENQDCVHQGQVTLENKEKRALQNMILCLPNEVIIELYSPEEIAAMETAPTTNP